MNNVGISHLINKVYKVHPIKVSKGSKFFNNRNDEETKVRTNKYAIKIKNATINKQTV